MKKIKPALILAALLLLAFGLYALQVVLFAKPSDTGFYFLQDLAFLPLQVAIVTLALGGFISSREKKERLRKIDMAINAFFSEAGAEIIRCLMAFERVPEAAAALLRIDTGWGAADFRRAREGLARAAMRADCAQGDLACLKTSLAARRDFMMLMLENPNLLEHDAFTDMLWAVFHLTDELLARGSLDNLPAADIAHLEGDIERAFGALLRQWLANMEHLKAAYPYLYSLEVRRNPFASNSVVFRD
ncbi:MAG TPA: hypothetical protein PL044_06680 [Clostridiales bacterium]|nr:MAG: hypothetical protein BWY37_00701 [Firmicutes bacterium ADurb.Bin262]HOU09305.1 hypothetical protein [Clostridiales bacterium]HQH63488.1 hypothetical protein [Clostridiales bacterium]HQK73443.1 hypothetical protein [Clostridiales bacterium]